MKICSRCNKIIGLYTPYQEISDNEILCSKCANKWLYEKLIEAYDNTMKILPGWKSSKERIKMKKYMVNIEGIQEMQKHLDLRIYVINIILEKIRYNLLGTFTVEEIEGWISECVDKDKVKDMIQELFTFDILKEVITPQGNTVEIKSVNIKGLNCNNG